MNSVIGHRGGFVRRATPAAAMVFRPITDADTRIAEIPAGGGAGTEITPGRIPIGWDPDARSISLLSPHVPVGHMAAPDRDKL
ncbi:MAG: hypothetical protein HC871_15265 [Rhizobiales bacterium]|nr:hypothetical protein [Hyphomicrobiales bacterium]